MKQQINTPVMVVLRRFFRFYVLLKAVEIVLLVSAIEMWANIDIIISI